MERHGRLVRKGKCKEENEEEEKEEEEEEEKKYIFKFPMQIYSMRERTKNEGEGWN